MSENITRMVQVCPKCHAPYDEEEGDVCQCVVPMVLPEEPAVPAGEWDSQLLGKDPSQ